MNGKQAKRFRRAADLLTVGASHTEYHYIPHPPRYFGHNADQIVLAPNCTKSQYRGLKDARRLRAG